MRELEERMDSAEITEWQQYYGLLAAADKAQLSIPEFLEIQRRAAEEGAYEFPEDA